MNPDAAAANHQVLLQYDGNLMATSSSVVPPAPTLQSPRQMDQWAFAETKLFENLLAEFDHVSLEHLQMIASGFPGKTISQIQKQYLSLVRDVQMIESGLIPLPPYTSGSSGNTIPRPGCDQKSMNIQPTAPPRYSSAADNKSSRKKGVPWTAEEHQKFLEGLEKFGKGDWRSISRNYVFSKNPAQVASHAQKYFLRVQKYRGGVGGGSKKDGENMGFGGAGKNKKKKRSAAYGATTFSNMATGACVMGGRAPSPVRNSTVTAAASASASKDKEALMAASFSFSQLSDFQDAPSPPPVLPAAADHHNDAQSFVAGDADDEISSYFMFEDSS